MNQISTEQNSGDNLAKLAAQRELYSRAKYINSIQLIMSVPLMILLSLVNKILGQTSIATFFCLTKPLDLSPLVGFFGIAIFILDISILAPISRNLIRKSAAIQELFDCTVLHLGWNKITAGSPPEQEDIANFARKHSKRKQKHALTDWYSPAVSGISLDVARFVCQRSNCWWDGNLRQKYRLSLLVIGVLLFLLLGCICIFRDWTYAKVITTVFAPFLPALALIARQYSENGKTIHSLSHLKAVIEDAWEKALSHNISSAEQLSLSRKVQDEIFHCRQGNPPIFDWLYNLLRDKQEHDMNYAAMQLVIEAKKRLGLN
jgi:hypothetical protein